jgi:hypothetical protein
MIFKALSSILSWLGGGVLDRVLGHLEARQKNQLDSKKLDTDVTIEMVKAEINRRSMQRDVLIKESESAVQWLPRFTFGMSAAFYFMACVIDSVFDLPGVVLILPDSMQEIMTVIVGGLFLDSGVKRVARAVATKKDQK